MLTPVRGMTGGEPRGAETLSTAVRTRLCRRGWVDLNQCPFAQLKVNKRLTTSAYTGIGVTTVFSSDLALGRSRTVGALIHRASAA